MYHISQYLTNSTPIVDFILLHFVVDIDLFSVVLHNLLISTNHFNGTLIKFIDLQIEINNGFTTNKVEGSKVPI